MRIADIAVATITWARSDAEQALLNTSLRRLTEAGMPVAVGDRGENTAFTRLLGSLPGLQVCVPSEAGLVSQIRVSMAAAATFGRRFILYVESDKHLFFGPHLRDFLERVPADDTLGVAIAGRSAASFATFPPMQRYTEGVINQLCRDLLGKEGDYSYGPFVMNRTLLPHIASFDPSIGWGWRHSMFAAAVRAGLDLVHFQGDYRCPPDQQHEDEAERRHRLRQLSQDVLGLLT
ncbi:MAG: hypothetical protein AB7N65_14030 [Vicinamibacterales bacterium]